MVSLSPTNLAQISLTEILVLDLISPDERESAIEQLGRLGRAKGGHGRQLVRRGRRVTVDGESLLVLGDATVLDRLGVDAGAQVRGDEGLVVLLHEETKAALVLLEGAVEE